MHQCLPQHISGDLTYLQVLFVKIFVRAVALHATELSF